MTRIKVALALLTMTLTAGLVLSSQKPEKQLPISGLNGTGIGYVVCAVDDVTGESLGIVEVPYHVINPEKRKKHGLPPLEMSEFDASVRNATALISQDAGTKRNWICSTVYRDQHGNVLGCKGACGDCVTVRVVPQIQ